MRPRRGHAKLAIVLAACAAVAVGGVIAARLITTDDHHTTAPLPLAPTTGSWTPLTVPAPKIPITGQGIPVAVDPRVTRNDFSSTMFPLDDHQYQMTVFNNSTLGPINSFQWYPPPGVRVVEVVDSTAGHCRTAGRSSILCDELDLKAPTCTCLGDGGSMQMTFVTDKDVAVGEGDLRVRAATLAFDRIRTGQNPSSTGARHDMRIATGGDGAVKSGGLTRGERVDAQAAMDALQNSNISFQLVAISRWVQSVPAACRIRVVPGNPSMYKVYVFWIPSLAANPYVWLDMNVTNDPRTSTFHLGAVQPVLSGPLNADGRTVDTSLLSRYGPEQARRSRQMLAAHGGDVFAKPGAKCQVLKNGSLRLLPG
jgi:hypothetical protein